MKWKPIKWNRVDYTSNRCTYALRYMDGLDERRLRYLILRLSGILPPDGLDKDKLTEWAGYEFEARRARSHNTQLAPEVERRWRRIRSLSTPAAHYHHRRKSALARKSFEKLKGRAPSAGSAMGTAFKLLDEHGDMKANKLLSMVAKIRKKVPGLNSVRSYLSVWRRGKRDAEKK